MIEKIISICGFDNNSNLEVNKNGKHDLLTWKVLSKIKPAFVKERLRIGRVILQKRMGHN